MQQNIEYAMGAAVILAAAAMIVKLLLDSATAKRNPGKAEEKDPEIAVKRILTVAIGVFGGLLVGITSVGSGSLMIVLLMMLYPRMSMRRLVGTDIVQSMPLVASAAVGHALFGGLEFGLTASITVGSIPGVIVGAWLSSRASNLLLRPILAFVLMASALKLLGLATDPLAITMGILVLVGLPIWAFIDGASRPDEAWAAAGYRRRRTLVLLTAGIPVAVGLVTAAIYFGRMRPRIVKAVGAHASPIAEPVAYAQAQAQQA
jgi:uncharacterized protein